MNDDLCGEIQSHKRQTGLNSACPGGGEIPERQAISFAAERAGDPKSEETDPPLRNQEREKEEKSRGSRITLEVVQKEEVLGRKDSWDLLGAAMWPDHRESSRRGQAGQPSSGYQGPPDAHLYCSL